MFTKYACVPVSTYKKRFTKFYSIIEIIRFIFKDWVNTKKLFIFTKKVSFWKTLFWIVKKLFFKVKSKNMQICWLTTYSKVNLKYLLTFAKMYSLGDFSFLDFSITLTTMKKYDLRFFLHIRSGSVRIFNVLSVVFM